MVLSNYKDNKLTNVLAVCDCGCSAISFTLMDDTIFITVYGLKFYDKQGGLWRLRDNFTHIGKKLIASDIFLTDIILSNKDVKELITKLSEFEFSDDDGYHYTNDSRLVIYPIDFGDEPVAEWDLLVKYEGSLVDILRNKTYRGYEICLKEDDFKMFISYLKNRTRGYL